MPRLGSNEQAFLSLVKSLHKGKGKENVPTDIHSLARPYGKINGDFPSAPTRSDIVDEATWPDQQPATPGVQQDWAETLTVNPLHGEDRVHGEANRPEHSPATYTVIGSNFAPGTTAADIEYALSETCGPMQGCRIISESPLVVAEIVFTEISRAQRVIATYDSEKADGYLLRLYMKPEDPNTPPKASCEEAASAQIEEHPVVGEILSQQRPDSPILRGRGRTRYRPMDGPVETLAGDERPALVRKSETSELKKPVEHARAEDDRTARKDHEKHNCAHTEGEFEGQDDADKENAGADGRRRQESWPAKLLDATNLGSEEEVARSIRLAEEEVKGESEGVRSFVDSTQRIVGREPTPSTIATANSTMAGVSPAMEEPVSSRPPSSAPTIAESATEPAAGTKSSMPLLSSGHAFLQALTKRPIPPKYTTTRPDSTQAPSLPTEILPDELPTATRTHPNSSNAPSSPLGQITSTGTLQTPSGEHRIHIRPPSTSVEDKTASQQLSATHAKPENHEDFFSEYRADSRPQNPPTSPTDHLPSNFALDSRPTRASPPVRTAHEIKTLTLLSGSGPCGHIYKPCRYRTDELLKIGNAYRQKVFLALLEKEGRGRIILGMTEGV